MSRGDRNIYWWAAGVILLAAFGVTSSNLTGESLWNDEAWTVWAVHSPYLADTLGRVQHDVHPPLYFLLLDGWTMLAGESAYAVRLLSVFWGLIGLAGTGAVAGRLFDRQTGLIAMILLGSASFFVYYTREARMYTLLLALSALATWAYLRWRSHPTWRRTLVYGSLLAALLYTHYAGALILATQVLHLLITGWTDRPRLPLRRGGLPYLLALILFVPWLPVFLSQMRANPNGPLAFPVATDWSAVAALALILTGGNWWLLFVPFVLGSGLSRLRQYGSAVLLLLLWLLLTPSALLALNAWIAPVYQVRYAIALLPGGALLIAYGLRFLTAAGGLLDQGLKTLGHRVAERRWLWAGVITGFLVSAIVYTQLSTYIELWPGKAPWEMTIRQMIAARQPLEPTITDLAPYSPAAYYDRQLGIRQGISLDLSWRLHNAQEVRQLAALFADAPSVWTALPVNTAKTWHLIAGLDAGRHVGYRSSLVNMVFYRFDPGDSDDLEFRFGDQVRYTGGPGAAEMFAVAQGDTLCVELAFKTLATLADQYSAGVHLVDITGTQTLAQWDGGLGSPLVGETEVISPCLNIPEAAAPGYYHLELTVYNWSDLKRLLVIEDGAGAGLAWGDVLMLAAVDVMESQ